MLDDPHSFPFKADIEAARTRMVGGSSGTQAVAISPVPAEASDPCEYRHHERRTAPDQAFPYIDANGRTVGYVARWERTEAHPDKIVRPLSWCRVGNRHQWRLKGWAAPFPLIACRSFKIVRTLPSWSSRGKRRRWPHRTFSRILSWCRRWGAQAAPIRVTGRPLPGTESSSAPIMMVHPWISR